MNLRLLLCSVVFLAQLLITQPLANAAMRAETYEDGLILGRRNGDLIANRIAARTIAVRGCAAVQEFHDAIMVVTRGIGSATMKIGSSRFGLGFARGYLEVLEIEEAKISRDCGEGHSWVGQYFGETVGVLTCQVLRGDLDGSVTLDDLASLSILLGEVGVDARGQCVFAATEALLSCTTDRPSDLDVHFVAELLCGF